MKESVIVIGLVLREQQRIICQEMFMGYFYPMFTSSHPFAI